MPTAEIRRERGTTGVGTGGTVEEDDTVQEDDGSGDSGFSARTTSGSTSSSSDTVDVTTNYGVSPDGSSSSNGGSSSDSEPEPGWVDDIPGAGAMVGPEDVAEIVDDRVTNVADEFSSGLEQTQEGFNRQIDELESSVEDSFSGVSRGIESTQQSVASIPSSLAGLFNGESDSDRDPRSGGEESRSGFPVRLAAAAVGVGAVVWSVTQN